MTKILSWNVNGVRSNILTVEPYKTSKKNPKPLNIEPESNFGKMIDKYKPDIVCLQETKCGQDIFDVINSSMLTEDSSPYFKYTFNNSSVSTQKARGSGYSGTAIWSKIPFISSSNVFHEKVYENISNVICEEGRLITCEFEDFYLINVYTPNSGSNEEFRTTIWDLQMQEHIKLLKEKKEVILVGDMNVCHKPIDIFSGFPSGNKRIAGLLPEEREGFEGYITDCDMLDSYRSIHGDKEGAYSWWNPKIKTFREVNNGWRIDYGLVTNGINVKDAGILSDVYGSDHCPIFLEV